LPRYANNDETIKNEMNRNETYKLVLGHDHKGQACGTRYFAKSKMSLNKCLNPSCNI
jgi:hypothetical protein